jgi:hypothetical protein
MTSLPQAQAWGLGGGEDFELVLALAPAWAEALIAALPGTTPIGELVAGEAGALGWMGGEAWSAGDGEGAASSGYSHFSGGVSGWGGSRKTRENASPKADCLKIGIKIRKWTFPSRPSAPSVWS